MLLRSAEAMDMTSLLYCRLCLNMPKSYCQLEEVADPDVVLGTVGNSHTRFHQAVLQPGGSRAGASLH